MRCVSVCGCQEGEEQLKHELSSSAVTGKRVRFKSTNYPHWRLRFNDLGTVVGVTNFYDHGKRQTKLLVRWDNGGDYTITDGFDSLDVFANAGI